MNGSATTQDYYEILGVKTDATQDEVRRAYRKLARQYHPDKTGGDAQAEEKLKTINAAYDVLKNEEKRKEYDQQRAFSGAFGGGGGFRPGFGDFEFHTDDPSAFSGIFESLFGGGGMGAAYRQQAQHPRPGRDLEISVPITLHDVANGGQKSFRIQREDANGAVTPRDIKVDVPKGIDDGMRLRVPGEGSPGFNGGPRGDLYVRVRVGDDPFFTREGRNLVCEVPITFAEAALGAKVNVPTLDGTAMLTVPAGTQNRARLRLRGMGLPGMKQATGGDQFVEIRVEVPVKLTREQKRLLKEYEDAASAAGSHPLMDAFRSLMGKLRGK